MCGLIPSPQALAGHLGVLAKDIGVRLAGSEGERAAAVYIAECFASCGARVRVEAFPVRERAVEAERLEVRVGGAWESFPGSLFANTPGTGGETVEAPLVFFEAPAERGRRDLAHLRGKAVVHLGCHIESREAYRALIEAGPAFLLCVDIRYPGAVPLADAMFPAYTEAVGAVPTFNVAYQDAWRWKTEEATAARLNVRGGMRDSLSRNVVAELPGDGNEAELLFVGAHHDTQAGSPGADDNASGVAGVLECARLLAERPRRRAVRLVSFGCEEQLSVGSAAYVRTHRQEIARRGRLMFNLDSCGSHLGWNDLTCNGPPDLERWITPRFPHDPLRIHREIMPYADHFPFVAAGVPSMTLIRFNCTTGRFFHHRPDDDLSRVSIPGMASRLAGVAACIDELARCETLPFAARIPSDQAPQAARLWEDLFGGW